MRHLFIKIFLYFLLTIILVTGAGVVLTYLRDQEFPPLANQHFARHAVADYGRAAIRAYEKAGIEAFDVYSERLFRDSGIRILLFDSAGRPLSRQHIPRGMLHMARRALQTGEVVLPMMGPRNWLASSIQGETGRTFAITIGLPGPPEPRHLLRGLTHGLLGWRLLILLLVAGAVCLLLARSLTAPITRLRSATRRLAAGDLATRVGDQVRGKNEIAGLARDFDDMAARIEGLVTAQKRLLRDISHELRSPLARLGVALELARQEGNPQVREKSLARIELEAERMNEMIGQLLSLTRLENDAGGLQRQAFDLVGLLERLVQDADFEARTRGCRVSFIAGPPVVVDGAEEMLARAIENVIRNAVRYTAAGTEVSVALVAAADRVLIGICDQGPGVPGAALDKLFEPFYRVADARDRSSGGSGIGLAIAERAVRLHGGTITAENRVSGGLEVRITLPLEGLRQTET